MDAPPILKTPTPLDARLYDYLLASTSPEPEVLADLRRETAKIEHGYMQTAPDQGALLALIARMIGARLALEVGVFTGYSSTSVALALPEDGRLIACDVSEEYTAVARRCWARAGVDGRIDLRLAPALQTLDRLLSGGFAGRFDLAFIDADKTGYPEYYERALALLRRGGIVAIDNVLWDGRVADPSVRDADTEAIRALNLRIAGDRRVDACMIAVGDGMTVARKR